MGLIIILIWAIYIFVAIAVIGLVYRFITRKLWVNIIIIIFALLLPTYDIILTNIFGAYYCSEEPNPKTYIKKKVKYPESIYWEDNVYPGFNAEDRKLMITNYLDGVHLKKMALNGDDGKVYVYESKDNISDAYNKLEVKIDKNVKLMNSANKTTYNELINTNKLLLKEKKQTMKMYVKNIIESKKIYTKHTMPNMRYTVTFNEVELDLFTRKFLYSDKTKIIDNGTNEVIAYNIRYMRFFYNILPDVALGNIYYSQYPVCGDSHLYYDGKGFGYIGFYGSRKHYIGLNNYLYNKYIKGEK